MPRFVLCSHFRRLWPFVGATLVVLLSARDADAQTGQPGSFLSVGVGAGAAHSFHGDLDFYAPALEGEIAFGPSRHVSVEIGGAQWRRVEEDVRLDVPIQGSGGLVGRVDRIEQRLTRVFSVFEVNALGGGRVGRVRLFGGGGAGLMTLTRTSRQVREGCSENVMCGTAESDFSSVSPTVQGVGRLEVPLAGRAAAYAAARLFVNLRDAGSSGVRFTGGVRVGFGN